MFMRFENVWRRAVKLIFRSGRYAFTRLSRRGCSCEIFRRAPLHSKLIDLVCNALVSRHLGGRRVGLDIDFPAIGSFLTDSDFGDLSRALSRHSLRHPK